VGSEVQVLPGPFLPRPWRGEIRISWRRYGGIAQLVEHLLCKQGVTGSNPVASMSARVGLTTDQKSSPDPLGRVELRASKAAALAAPRGSRADSSFDI
jgi:hypothetical protein